MGGGERMAWRVVFACRLGLDRLSSSHSLLVLRTSSWQAQDRFGGAAS